ncbi:MAG: hypothetical protein ACTTH8_02255 [Treponema sp.]
MLPVSAVQGGSTAGTPILQAFRFSDTELLQSLLTEDNYAVELTVAASAVDYEAARHFSLSFLYDDDFSSNGTLKNSRTVRPAVTGGCPQPARPLTISMGLGNSTPDRQRIHGLLLMSSCPLIVQKAALIPARYGWQKTAHHAWCGFTAQGGHIPPVIFQHSSQKIETSFLPLPQPPQEQPVRTVLKIFTGAYTVPASWEKAPLVSIHTGKKRIKIRPVPHRHEYTIDTTGVDSAADTIIVNENADLVTGILLETKKISNYEPITADTGLILNWQQSAWRNSRYEFFSWELFPSVLVFDCADYRIQDRLFKRLSFFAEKKGFTGRLLTDKELKKYHGFNAHDYGAQTLADFFNKAAESAFPLTAEEEELKTILLHNGILCKKDGCLCAGTGAVVSISRETLPYLRSRFITHECLHGIYFTEERFRKTVDSVFYAADPRVIQFFRRYFELTDSLNYDTDNEYLLKNEFMAYLLQQKAVRIPAYFAQILAHRKIISNYEPALCRYIQKTNARDLVQAAEKLNTFLYAAWGIQGGRIQSITIEDYPPLTNTRP